MRECSTVRVGKTHVSIILTIAVTAMLYGVWLNTERPFDHPESLAGIGDRFLAQGNGGSTAIDELDAAKVPGSGYDGQFFLFMAIDLTRAPAYVDVPRYRLSRVGFPVAAATLAGRNRSVIPWVMLSIELAAVLATTGLLAVMVSAGGGSAFLALLYGLAPGLFISASRLLSEAPANALALLGVFLWLRGRNGPRATRTIALAGVVFAAAALTRETTLLFPLGIATWMVTTSRGSIRARIGPAALLVGLAMTPLLCWHVFLIRWLPLVAMGPDSHLVLLPFGGLVAHGASSTTVLQTIAVVAPACLMVVITAAGTRWSVWTSVILLNAAVLVVFLPILSYADFAASGRITLPVLLTFVLAIPAVRGRLRLYGVPVVGILVMLPWLYFFPRYVF